MIQAGRRRRYPVSLSKVTINTFCKKKVFLIIHSLFGTVFHENFAKSHLRCCRPFHPLCARSNNWVLTFSKSGDAVGFCGEHSKEKYDVRRCAFTARVPKLINVKDGWRKLRICKDYHCYQIDAIRQMKHLYPK